MNKKHLENRIQRDKKELNDLRREEYCRLLDELKEQGVSQIDIAEKLKITEQTVSNAKYGRTKVGEKLLNKLRQIKRRVR